MSTFRHPAGIVVADDLVHACVNRLFRQVAACGAGRIVQQLRRGFDGSRPEECPACAAALTGRDAADPS